MLKAYLEGDLDSFEIIGYFFNNGNMILQLSKKVFKRLISRSKCGMSIYIAEQFKWVGS